MTMAFLSSFLAGRDLVYPESLHQRLSEFPLLANVGDAGVRRLLAEANWFSLPGGMMLERDGENFRALFLVLTGSLGVFYTDPDGSKRLVAQVSAGETVGEMALISGELPSAQVVALRDTELLRVSARGFEQLISRHPPVMLNLLRVLMRRLNETARQNSDRPRPRTFAMIPLQEGLADEMIADKLSAALNAMGARSAVLNVREAERPTEWLNNFEADHDFIFYRGDMPDSAWTHLCLRQADRIFLLARSDRPLPLRPLDVPAFKERSAGLPELLLLHPESHLYSLPEHFAVHSGLFEAYHHIRSGQPEDIRRLARFVAERAVGLVLAGGGARGFAHIGVIKALMETGVPFDHFGGTSVGAIIAAGLACEWSLDELTARMKAAFVETNPLSDYTLPLIALVRGKKVSDLLREHFGQIRIEELAKPYFCVSSDLTTGRIHLHRDGPVWRALRASVSLPGILPPVTYHGHLLVDGGVMNNLPVDIIAQQARGPIIASDVTGEYDVHVSDSRYGERPLWWLIWQRMRGTPSIVSILMRSGTVGSEAQRKLVREQADFVFEPPLQDVGLRDWRKFERAIAEGYSHAMAMIEKHGVPLTDAWTEGPALAIPERATRIDSQSPK